MGRSKCKDIAAKFDGHPLHNDFMLIREGLKKGGMDPVQASIEAERQALALPEPTGNRFHYGADIQNADEKAVKLKLAQIAYKAGDRLDKPPKAASGDDDEYIQELVLQLGNRQAKHTAIVPWIYRNHLRALRDLDVDEIPDAGALGHWLHVKQGGASAYESFLDVWSKMLPTKQQLDKEDRFRDDGRNVFTLIDNYLQRSEDAESSEGTESEPEVSQADASAWAGE